YPAMVAMPRQRIGTTGWRPCASSRIGDPVPEHYLSMEWAEIGTAGPVHHCLEFPDGLRISSVPVYVDHSRSDPAPLATWPSVENAWPRQRRAWARGGNRWSRRLNPLPDISRSTAQRRGHWFRQPSTSGWGSGYRGEYVYAVRGIAQYPMTDRGVIYSECDV